MPVIRRRPFFFPVQRLEFWYTQTLALSRYNSSARTANHDSEKGGGEATDDELAKTTLSLIYFITLLVTRDVPGVLCRLLTRPLSTQTSKASSSHNHTYARLVHDFASLHTNECS